MEQNIQMLIVGWSALLLFLGYTLIQEWKKASRTAKIRGMSPLRYVDNEDLKKSTKGTKTDSNKEMTDQVGKTECESATASAEYPEVHI